MNEENFEAYFVMKSVEYVIYESVISEENLLLFESKDYFDLFKNVVITFNELETLDDDVKDNVYKILSQIKEMKNLQYDPLEDINEIIIKLNIPTNKESVIQYYQEQLYLRTNDKEVLKYGIDDIYPIKDSLFFSIRNDYVVLYTHIILDDESFMKEINDVDINNYISSILVILDEYPSIFKDELFYQRVCKVLDKINDNKKKLDISIRKKILKRINKIRRK